MDKNKAMAKRQEVENYAASLEQQIEACKTTRAELQNRQSQNITAHNLRIAKMREVASAKIDKAATAGYHAVNAKNDKLQLLVEDEVMEQTLLEAELKTARQQAVVLTKAIAEESTNGERSF